MKTRRDILLTSAAFLAAPTLLRAQDDDTAQPLQLEINDAAAAATEPAPIVPLSDDPLAPTLVSVQPGIPAGEIHVDPNRFRLYWTLGEGQAIRYAVGIGRRGLYEAGTFRVGRKAEWPDWRPTDEMIERDPASYAKFADGMPGGPNNPLGARALYLYDGNRDTYLRIHGTNAPQTIGTAVSNGCARLTNEYIVDLYNRVPVNTRAILYTRFT